MTSAGKVPLWKVNGVTMIDVETAISYLATWAWRKARNLAGREMDGALEQAMNRLHTVVSAKLAGDPVFWQLEDEAASGSSAEVASVQPATVVQMRKTLESAARTDPGFEAELARLISRLQAAERHVPGSVRANVVGVSGGGATDIRDGNRFGWWSKTGGVHISVRKGAGIGGVLLVLVVAGAAAWYYVPISRYQKQVQATCQQMYDVTSTEHPEVAYLSASAAASGNPADMFHLNKKTYLRVMKSRLDQLDESFTALSAHRVPGSLAEDKSASDVAFASYLKEEKKSIAVAKARLRHGMTMSQAEDAGVDFDGSPSARVRLNSAMSKLAGEECSAIASKVSS